jgi:hypothetical protein
VQEAKVGDARRVAFSIFIIGPMRKTGDGIAVASHTTVLRGAVEALLHKHHLADVGVTAPDDLRGATIATDVFTRLDAADLVIADLSEGSPNVLYELAFVDALGLPTILVCDDDTDVPFYFRGHRVQKLGAITADAVTAALEPLLPGVIRGEGTHDLVSNPLRDFYHAPVVDISAAAGLAIGYYENFVREVIRNDGILDASAGRARGLLVVVPTRLANRRDDRQAIEDEAAALAGLPIERDQQFPRPGNDRAFTAALLGGLVLDVPSAPYSLDKSPRIRQLRRRFGTLHALARSEREAMVAQMTRSLLAAFERALRDQIDDDHDTHADRVLVRAAADLPAAIGAARTAGWLG